MPTDRNSSDLKISVVVCNYNYGHYILDAIGSVQAQSHAAHEIIVVDDGSTDDSVAKVQTGAAGVTLISKANGGQISAYNAGFEHVTADIVVFLDSDDRLKSDALQEIARAFANERVLRVQYRLRLIDNQGRPTAVVIPSMLSEGDKADQVRRGVLFLASPGSGNAYRVSALRQLMPLPETNEERHGADFFTGYGLALLGRVCVIPDDLAEYRVHNQVDSENLCFGNAKLGMTEAEMLQSRYRRFRRWIAERLSLTLPAERATADFSIEKQDFARAVFTPPTYWAGVKGGLQRLPFIYKSLRYRDNAWWFKAALMTWALIVLALPRALGMPLARYVCNPTSRVSGVAHEQ